MGVLTKKQLDEVWNQGLDQRVKRFHAFLVERGLMPLSVPEHLFSDHVYEVLLLKYFVKDEKVQQ
jgi:hypothetical protein